MNKKLLISLGLSGSLLFSVFYFDLVEYKDNVLKVKFYKGAELNKTTHKKENKVEKVSNENVEENQIIDNSEQDIAVSSQNNEKYVKKRIKCVKIFFRSIQIKLH